MLAICIGEVSLLPKRGCPVVASDTHQALQVTRGGSGAGVIPLTDENKSSDPAADVGVLAPDRKPALPDDEFIRSIRGIDIPVYRVRRRCSPSFVRFCFKLKVRSRNLLLLPQLSVLRSPTAWPT
jgi:hypothetical protein